MAFWTWQNTLREKKCIRVRLWSQANYRGSRWETFCLAWAKCWGNVEVFWCETTGVQELPANSLWTPGGQVLQVQDMTSTWNGEPKSSSRFGSILYLPWLCFPPPHLCLMIWSYAQIGVWLAKSVWKACRVLGMGTTPRIIILLLAQGLDWFRQHFLPCFKTPRLGTSGSLLTLEYLLNSQSCIFLSIAV